MKAELWHRVIIYSLTALLVRFYFFFGRLLLNGSVLSGEKY